MSGSPPAASVSTRSGAGFSLTERPRSLALGFHPVCHNYPGKLDNHQRHGRNTTLNVVHGRVVYLDVEINAGCPNRR